MFRKVVCAMSGGVDSSVTAYLLKQKGFDVTGIFMRNWDKIVDGSLCTADEDYEDARNVCKKFNIPFVEVCFSQDYWNEVFTEFIEDYQNGLTPNPDILCNKRIKFDVLFRYVRDKLDADALATGHYAQSSFGNYLEHFVPDKGVRLMRSVDPIKDQTFFLSQVSQAAFQRTMFPIGKYFKSEVKKIAESIDLYKIARKHESMGICFIGNLRFQSFIQEFIDEKPGYFIDIETNEVIGEHKGIHMWTLGQRSKLSNGRCAYYIVKKDVANNNMFVAPGQFHPSLFSQQIVTDKPHWIHSKPVSNLQNFRCDFCFQHVNPLVPCNLNELDDDKLFVTFETPLRAVTAGQYAVFYKGNICLGSAKILEVGPSLYKT